MANISEFIKNHKVDFLRISIIDIVGNKRSIEFPIEAYKDIIKDYIKCDGSSICNIGTTDDSDKIISLDENSFYLVSDNTLEVFGFLESENKNSKTLDSRKILQNQIDILNSQGFSLNVGIEPEFYFLDEETLDPIDDGKYFSIDEQYSSTKIRRQCAKKLLEAGFDISSFHHEVGPGQNEINFHYSNPMKIADTFYLYKEIVKKTAYSYGYIATFLPKPFDGIPGSGMHLNCSIYSKDGKNMFYDENEEKNFSLFGKRFTCGILKHIKGLCALSATIDNSYLRLHSGLEAPNVIFYSFNNREAAIRIPSAKEERKRIELRFVDSTSQLYLLLAGIIIAGIDGINHPFIEIEDKDLLPKSFDEAAKYFQEDEILVAGIGKEMIEKYVLEKSKKEIGSFEKLLRFY